jgi:cystinosin
MAYFDDSSPLLSDYGKEPLLLNQWNHRRETEEEQISSSASQKGLYISVEDVTDTTLLEVNTPIQMSSSSSSWRDHPFPSLMRGIFTFLSDDSGDPRHIYRGLGTIVCIGILLGIVFPNDRYQLPGRWYPHLSSMIGYTYVTAWSLSFYPQLSLNLRNRHTQGLSQDFCYLNVLGFLCYTIFNVSMAYSPTLQYQYAATHNGQRIHIAPNDIAFAVHALILSTIWVLQIWYYNRIQSSSLSSTPKHSPPASNITLLAIGTIVTLSIIYALLILILSPSSSQSNLTGWWNWLAFMYTLANIKVVITIVKYCPQVLLNCRRKSTVGWNIWNILLDFLGGILSVTQLILDSWCTTHDFWSGIAGYPAKFVLGCVSILFDVSSILFFLCFDYHMIFLKNNLTIYALTTSSPELFHSLY